MNFTYSIVQIYLVSTFFAMDNLSRFSIIKDIYFNGFTDRDTSNICFYKHTTLRTWQKAVSSCANSGGQLLQVHTAVENASLVSKLGYELCKLIVFICLTHGSETHVISVTVIFHLRNVSNDLFDLHAPALK